ncbi:MAG: purine-nucleoside phosphorylase [Rhodothermales bacterium]
MTPVSTEDPPRVLSTPDFVAAAARLGEAIREAAGVAPLVVAWVPDPAWLEDPARQRIGNVGVTALAGNVVLSSLTGNRADQGVLAARAAAHAGADIFVVLDTCASFPRPTAEGGKERVVVSDHINLTGENPLAGPNVAAWGVRFPDMTDPYTQALRIRLSTIGREVVLAGIPATPAGVTRQDLERADQLGATAVSSGVVHAVIAARHSGLRVAACCVVQKRPEATVRADGRALVTTVLGLLTE